MSVIWMVPNSKVFCAAANGGVGSKVKFRRAWRYNQGGYACEKCIWRRICSHFCQVMGI
jgi:hypothetical protein